MKIDNVNANRITQKQAENAAAIDKNLKSEQENLESISGKDKVSFSEDARIGHKGVGGIEKAGRKIVPNRNTAHVKQDGVHAIGGDVGNLAKDEQKHHRRNDGLNDMPYRTQYGLLVLRCKIALYKEDK